MYVILGIGLIIWAFWYDNTDFKPKQKKNGKMTRPYHKHWLLWTIAVILVVGGIGMDDDKADSSSAKTEQAKKTKPKKHKEAKKITSKKSKPKKDTQRKETVPKKTESKKAPAELKKKTSKKKPAFSNADKEAATLILLKKSYKGQAKVWFDADDKAFMIQPTSEDFKEELLDVVADQDTDDWKQLTDSIDAVLRSLYKNVKLTNFVSIVNPDNPDKVLYSSLNGKTAYDFLKNDE